MFPLMLFHGDNMCHGFGLLFPAGAWPQVSAIQKSNQGIWHSCTHGSGSPASGGEPGVSTRRFWLTCSCYPQPEQGVEVKAVICNL
jgi:hypothetical protein